MKRIYPLLLGGTSIFLLNACQKEPKLPNILWLTCEDISPFLGCYGDSLAITPNLDRFAKEAILYENAFANAPVSGPSRSTIITGCYANSLGTHPMSSMYHVPDEIRLFPEFLRNKGYFCTNNQKTHYQIQRIGVKGMEFEQEAWNENSYNAHYTHRKKGQPFFAIYNATIPHESCIHISHDHYNMLHRPDSMKIAPYHPDHPIVRHDYAQLYDQISLTDAWFGGMIAKLEKEGLLDDTIIFFYSDHGGIIGRSKRFANESGLRVPLMVRFPKKYQYLAPQKPGTRCQRMVSFVDLAPTMLHLTGIEIPPYMQGQPFLGKDLPEAPQYTYGFENRMDAKFDMRRTVRDQKFRYIRNYMTYKPYGKYIEFLWKAPSMRIWESEFKKGNCNEIQSIFWNKKQAEELYLIAEDPYEINNLANRPEYQQELKRLRRACDEWMIDIKDAGFIPEAMRETFVTGEIPLRDFTQSAKYPIQEIIQIANRSIDEPIEKWQDMIDLMKHENPIIRFWALNWVLNHEDDILDQKVILSSICEAIRPLFADNVTVNRLKAAQCIMMFEPTPKTAQIICKELYNRKEIIRTQAMDIMLEMGMEGKQYFKKAIDHYAIGIEDSWAPDKKVLNRLVSIYQ